MKISATYLAVAVAGESEYWLGAELICNIYTNDSTKTSTRFVNFIETPLSLSRMWNTKLTPRPKVYPT